MAAITVSVVDLKLRVPASLRAEAARLQPQAAETFLPAALRVMYERLERLHGRDARIRIRSLSIRCRIAAELLCDAAAAAAVGEDMADQISRLALQGGDPILPASEPAVCQVYRDKAHEAAASLASALRHEAEDAGASMFDEAWGVLRQAAPSFLARVLRRIAKAGQLEMLANRLGAVETDWLVRRLADAAPAVARRLSSFRTASADARPAAVKPDRRSPPETPKRPPARRRERPSQASAMPRSAVGAGDASLQSEDAPPAEPPAKPDREPGPLKRRAKPGSQIARRRDAEARRASPETAVPLPALSAPSLPDVHAPQPGEELLVARDSKWCALLYLVNVTQRLELAERLWQVGIDEGAALAHMFERLCRSTKEPAPRVLSKMFPARPPAPPALASWARDEVVRGADRAAAALLAPVADQQAFESRMAAHENALRVGAGWDLAAWGAALHLTAAELAIGGRADASTFAALSRFRRPGRIEVLDGAIRVVQPAGAIDMEVRRAGLDGNPGWLPWLGRKLEFVFATAGEDEA
jgi:hypothetical protein